MKKIWMIIFMIGLILTSVILGQGFETQGVNAAMGVSVGETYLFNIDNALGKDLQGKDLNFVSFIVPLDLYQENYDLSIAMNINLDSEFSISIIEFDTDDVRDGSCVITSTGCVFIIPEIIVELKSGKNTLSGYLLNHPGFGGLFTTTNWTYVEEYLELSKTETYQNPDFVDVFFSYEIDETSETITIKTSYDITFEIPWTSYLIKSISVNRSSIFKKDKGVIQNLQYEGVFTFDNESTSQRMFEISNIGIETKSDNGFVNSRLTGYIFILAIIAKLRTQHDRRRLTIH